MFGFSVLVNVDSIVRLFIPIFFHIVIEHGQHTCVFPTPIIPSMYVIFTQFAIKINQMWVDLQSSHGSYGHSKDPGFPRVYRSSTTLTSLPIAACLAGSKVGWCALCPEGKWGERDWVHVRDGPTYLGLPPWLGGMFVDTPGGENPAGTNQDDSWGNYIDQTAQVTVNGGKK